MRALLSPYGRIYSQPQETARATLTLVYVKRRRREQPFILGAGKQDQLDPRSLMAGNLNIDIRKCHRAKIGVSRSFGHDIAHLNPVLSPILVESVLEQIRGKCVLCSVIILLCRTEAVFRVFYPLFGIYIGAPISGHEGPEGE